MSADSAADVAELTGLETPLVVNALKALGVAPVDIASLPRAVARCLTPGADPVAGRAVTVTVSTSTTRRPQSELSLLDAIDAAVAGLSGPLFLVVENVGDPAGRVCAIGEIVASRAIACGVVAAVTNGPVRDLPQLADLGLMVHAPAPDVGGGYVDVVRCGVPVHVGGVPISPGDVLVGDVHGVVAVPTDLVRRLRGAAAEVEATERELLEQMRRGLIERPSGAETGGRA